MVDTIHTLFKELKQSWEKKKKEEIYPLYTGHVGVTIQKLTYTLESIVKKILKKIECEALKSINFASQFDQKLNQFSEQLANAAKSENRIQHYKTLFDEMFKLDEQWKSFQPQEPQVAIQYNPFEIEKKIAECIKVCDMKKKEEETKITTSLFGRRSQVQAVELKLNEEIKPTSDKERESDDLPTAYPKFLITKKGTFYMDTRIYRDNQEFIHHFFDYAAFQLEQHLYFCGGFHYYKGFTRMLTRKDQFGKMKFCQKMSYARCCLGLGGAMNCLAAIGGKDDKGVLKTYEKYDIIRNKWEFAESLLVARLQPGVCQTDPDTVYAFCGYQGNALDTVEKYSKNKGWVSLNAILSYPAFNIAAAVYGKDIIIFGGYAPTKEDDPRKIMTLFNVQQNKFIDLQENVNTPLYMSTRPYIVHGKEIFVGFQIKEKELIYHFNSEFWKCCYHA